MRICIIFNPAARGEKARRFQRHLGEISSQCALKETVSAGDARRIAAQAVEDGFEIVVAAGGDGTVNEVLNGIGDAPGGFAKARLGVLPLGTVNVFAREVGIPSKLELAWNIIRRARETRIDLPLVEFSSSEGVRRRYFAQLAGAGLDARAIELVHWPLKKRIGPLAYIVAGLNALRETRSPVTVTAGNRSLTGELVLIGNGQLYGGPFTIFPQADLRDGQLEVCVFPRANWQTLARCGPTLLWRGALPAAATETLRAPVFTVTSTEPTPLEIDGEWIGRLPAAFSLQPLGLRIIGP